MDTFDVVKKLTEDIINETVTDFQDAKWIDDPATRYEMVHELIDRLHGLAKLGTGDYEQIIRIHYEVISEGHDPFESYRYIIGLLTRVGE